LRHGAKKFILWMVALLLFVAMLWSANLAAYHWWAADFASSVSRDWDRSWGNRFAILTALFLGSLIYALRLSIKKK
jgi:hypothetical protein